MNPGLAHGRVNARMHAYTGNCAAKLATRAFFGDRIGVKHKVKMIAKNASLMEHSDLQCPCEKSCITSDDLLHDCCMRSWPAQHPARKHGTAKGPEL
mmetsp:Transcript_40975/g.72049  ORF Transcript_40975/g.72049 Transcript_40975/m.72049 type:complete len:97 (-) Transcript_40975:757-1047(-)